MTNKKYLLYLACKPSECRLFEFSNCDDNIISFSLFESLKAFCGFHWSEVVHTVFPGYSLLVDEQGKMKSEPEFNRLGSVFYGNPLECIVGNCFLYKDFLCDMAFLSDYDFYLLSNRFPELKNIPLSLWSSDVVDTE